MKFINIIDDLTAKDISIEETITKELKDNILSDSELWLQFYIQLINLQLVSLDRITIKPLVRLAKDADIMLGEYKSRFTTKEQ